MNPAPWATPESRLAELDREVDELYADGLIDADRCVEFLNFNPTAAATEHLYNGAKATCRALRTNRLADWLAACMYARWTEEECRSLVRAIELGVPLRELWDLGLTGLNCMGEDLQSISTPTLVQRMKAAQQLMTSPRPSRWLAGYGRRLARESRRRKGLAPEAH